MRAMPLMNKPVRAPVNPGIEFVSSHGFHRRFNHVGLQDTLFDNREIRPDKHTAVESGDGRAKPQRPDQHLHATWWPAARDGKLDPGGAHVCDGSARTLGQYLVPCYQRAVNIGE